MAGLCVSSRVQQLFAGAAVLAVLVCAGVVRGTTARAQEKAAAKPDMGAVVVDLDDIEKLRILAQLKLQPDQMDKLAAAISSAQADYDLKVNALGATLFGPVASEVRGVRKDSLSGSAVPKEFEDKMRKIQVDFLKQRDDLNTANIKAVAVACKAVLTDQQVAAATKQERELWNKDHPDGKGATDVQLYNLYCVDIFIASPRVVTLLKEMRAAAK